MKLKATEVVSDNNTFFLDLPEMTKDGLADGDRVKPNFEAFHAKSFGNSRNNARRHVHD
jgi:hypothetical protein